MPMSCTRQVSYVSGERVTGYAGVWLASLVLWPLKPPDASLKQHANELPTLGREFPGTLLCTWIARSTETLLKDLPRV